MDNGNQVKDIFIQSKKHFLKDDFNAMRKPRAMYDLEAEFRKTKKNKNKVVSVFILLLVLVFSALALVVTSFIQEGTKNVSVKINDFTELGLKDILDRAKKLESDYSVKQQEYNDILKERDDTLQQLKTDAAQEILLLNSIKISDTEKQAGVTRINLILQTGLGKAGSKYRNLTDNKQQEIAQIKEQIDREDADKVKLAKENEVILDNQKKLFDLQLNERIKYYEEKIKGLGQIHKKELQKADTNYKALTKILNDNHIQEIGELILKYNPIYVSGAVKELLEQMDGKEITTPATASVYFQGDLFSGEDVYTIAEFSDLQLKIGDFYLVLDKIMETEYTNDVPKSLNFIKYQENIIIGEYEKLWQSLANVAGAKIDVILRLNETMVRIRSILDSILDKKSGEIGFIADIIDVDNIIVYFSKEAQVAVGDVFSIFDYNYKLSPENNKTGSIKISALIDEMTAYAAEVRPALNNIPIKKFDRVLINIK